MPDERPQSVACNDALREVLLGYLQAAGCPPWPGTDGLTVDEVLLSYRLNARAGRVPDQQALLQRHPELADSLLAFFGSEDGAMGRS